MSGAPPQRGTASGPPRPSIPPTHSSPPSVLQGEVKGLEGLSDLLGEGLLLLPAVLALPPVRARRDVQNRLAGQHLPEGAYRAGERRERVCLLGHPLHRGVRGVNGSR